MRRSVHSLSKYNLLTCDMGQLVPVGLWEVCRGDSFRHRVSALIRVSPLVAPVMHPVTVRFHSFYVRNRVLWPATENGGWEDFITGGEQGTNTQTVPVLSSGAGFAAKSIPDFMGVPPTVGNLDINALPIRGFNLIFNEYYRDQDLQAKRALTEVSIPNVSWEKDYFTTCRTSPQKGPQVTLPIGATAPVVPTSGTAFPIFQEGSNAGAERTLGGNSGQPSTVWREGWTSGTERAVWKTTNLEADLANATGTGVRELREALAIQRFQENRSRWGARYTEFLAFQGIRSSDRTLQRPEYLGGGKQTIAFSEVLQTADDNANQNPLGRLGGHGISAVRTLRYRRFFEEDGWVITLMSVRPKVMYADSLDRHWLKRNKEDFFQQELQQVGQQEVTNREVRAAHSAPTGVFGFQDRYAEYKHARSHVCSEFRTTLDFWHLARKFSTDPALNESFIKCVPSKRIHAAQANDVLWVMVNHQLQARRMVRKSASNRIL